MYDCLTDLIKTYNREVGGMSALRKESLPLMKSGGHPNQLVFDRLVPTPGTVGDSMEGELGDA
jgi:hypothetical protein